MRNSHTIPVLLASPRAADRHLLAEALPYPDYSIRWAESVSEARVMLARHEIAVVLCDAALPGGGWAALLEAMHDAECPAKLIVTALHADERLWAEVLNLGGFDVLARPWSKIDLTRAIECASFTWQQMLTPA